MIIWRAAPGGQAADVIVRGMTIARIHVTATRWRITVLSGEWTDTATSIGHAKQAALNRLAEVLPEASTVVHTALSLL